MSILSSTFIGRIKFLCRILRSLHKSAYINFKYLPFKQAIKFPILLYKPRFGKLGGGNFN